MNNIRQKNAIYSTKVADRQPFAVESYVNNGDKCGELNAAVVNAGLRQLLENDLYAEKTLTQTSAYSIGPKSYDESRLDNAPDGYKVYGDLAGADHLNVLHKVETPIGDTLARSDTVDQEIDAMYGYGNTVFVASNGRVYKSAKPSDDIWDVVPGVSNATCFCEAAGHLLIGTRAGAYLLSVYMASDENDPLTYGKTIESAVKIVDSDISFTSLFYDSAHQTLFIGTGSEILTCNYKPGDTSVRNFNKIMAYVLDDD